MLNEDSGYWKRADVHNQVITSEELTGFGDFFVLFFSLMSDADTSTGCVSAEGESKCVNEELEEQVINAFPLVNLDSQTSQKAKSLMLKL